MSELNPFLFILGFGIGGITTALIEYKRGQKLLDDAAENYEESKRHLKAVTDFMNEVKERYK